METQLATTESNASVIYQRMSDPMAAVKEMGQMFAASGMFGVTKLEQGQVLALACLIEGKSPFELMRNYHIINGSLSMRSVAVLAEFQKKGGRCEWHSALNNVDEASATFIMGSNEPLKATYSIADATREGLIAGPNKHNWTARPADMLRARLITKAVRMIAPGIIMGVADEQEAVATPVPIAGPLLATITSAPVSTIESEPFPLEDMLKQDGITEEQAIAFLKVRNLLKDGEVLKDLTKASRNRVTKDYGAFAQRVQEHTAATTPVQELNERTSKS